MEIKPAFNVSMSMDVNTTINTNDAFALSELIFTIADDKDILDILASDKDFNIYKRGVPPQVHAFAVAVQKQANAIQWRQKEYGNAMSIDMNVTMNAEMAFLLAGLIFAVAKDRDILDILAAYEDLRGYDDGFPPEINAFALNIQRQARTSAPRSRSNDAGNVA